MNYSKNVRFRRKPKLPVFVKRVLISWLVVLIIGGVIGFIIGFSVRSVDAQTKPVNAVFYTSKATSTPTVKPLETESPANEPTIEVFNLGTFKLTAYCPCEECCNNWGRNRPKNEDGELLVYTASGELAKEGVTIAADTNILPFGTKVIIDGSSYIVQDRGGKIKGNRIDVYFEKHQDALEFGVQNKEIYIERMIEND